MSRESRCLLKLGGTVMIASVTFYTLYTTFSLASRLQHCSVQSIVQTEEIGRAVCRTPAWVCCCQTSGIQPVPARWWSQPRGMLHRAPAKALRNLWKQMWMCVWHSIVLKMWNWDRTPGFSECVEATLAGGINAWRRPGATSFEGPLLLPMNASVVPVKPATDNAVCVVWNIKVIVGSYSGHCCESLLKTHNMWNRKSHLTFKPSWYDVNCLHRDFML